MINPIIQFQLLAPCFPSSRNSNIDLFLNNIAFYEFSLSCLDDDSPDIRALLDKDKGGNEKSAGKGKTYPEIQSP
jgi:hypothetical protein